ncbi:MAG: T9SS type A sorting domain-containing protein [candidate division Zixibacteria bacterium]|nr:T9SS type A sorting domain-containing protein [candidate division Zixibacteria bacterium]
MVHNKMLHAILLAIILTIPAAAQIIDIFEGSSTAGSQGGAVMFNCDFLNPIGLPGFGVYVNYKGQLHDEYNQREMQLMGELPYYSITYEFDQYFDDPQGLMNFYFSAGTDTLKATQSPENTADQFPPESYLYAPFTDDLIGDAIDPIGNWLDLTGSGMCYSDTRIYGYLQNDTGTWPSSQGLDAFIYVLGFMSLDSTMYAMVYGNIPFILTPGLYKFVLADTSFTQLGDIDYEVADDLLHMAADLSDFENDPEWEGWPPPGGFIMSMGITITAGFTEQALNDFTFPTFYVPETQYLDFDNNTAPEITDYWFDIVPGVTVIPRVKYLDEDNNQPMDRTLFFNWGFYDMASWDHTYSDTSLFEHVMAWPGDGWSYFHYEFSDGVETFETPQDSIYLTTTDIEDNSLLPRRFSLNQNYPNPFNGSTSITFDLPENGPVNLTIYDMLGREVAEIVNGNASNGQHTIVWDGKNSAGRMAPSGVYFYKLTAMGQSITRKMSYLK